MKSQRRHELEQNELAQWLGEVIGKVKPYQNVLLGALIVLLLGTLAYALWSRQTGSRSAAAWTALFEAMESNDVLGYDDIIEQYPGTTAADFAAALAGDYHLSEGCRLLFENKANANQELRKATEYYLQVLEASDESSLRERATFGLARALEAQARDLDEAVARYREVVENWPDGAFAVAAQRRLEDLQRVETKALYDRFAKFDPKPAFGDEPGVPGQKPPFELDSLPEGAPLFTPSSPFGSSPAEKPEGGAAPPGEIPGTPADAANTATQPASTPAEPAGASAEPPSSGVPAGTPAEPAGAPAEPAGTPAEPAGTSAAPANTAEQPTSKAQSVSGQSPGAAAPASDQPAAALPGRTPEAPSDAAPGLLPASAEGAATAESPDTADPKAAPASGS